MQPDRPARIGHRDSPHERGAVYPALALGVARGAIPPGALILKPCKFAVKPVCDRTHEGPSCQEGVLN